MPRFESEIERSLRTGAHGAPVDSSRALLDSRRLAKRLEPRSHLRSQKLRLFPRSEMAALG
jgi:hypothetical protein